MPHGIPMMLTIRMTTVAYVRMNALSSVERRAQVTREASRSPPLVRSAPRKNSTTNALTPTKAARLTAPPASAAMKRFVPPEGCASSVNSPTNGINRAKTAIAAAKAAAGR